jgi:hypothetical protein
MKELKEQQLRKIKLMLDLSINEKILKTFKEFFR